MNKVYIIGIGPGAKDYLLPIAKREIQRADCLIGAKRALILFKHLDKEKICLKGDFKKMVRYIKDNKSNKKIVVLVSGDTGLFSFLGQIQYALGKEEYEVIPGISSMQLAFARIGESWQDAKIISLHGRKNINLAKEVKKIEKVFLFTDEENSPQKIAAYLINKRIKNRRVIVFDNLSYYNEKIVDTNLKNLSKMKGFGLCVMIIKL